MLAEVPMDNLELQKCVLELQLCRKIDTKDGIVLTQP